MKNEKETKPKTQEQEWRWRILKIYKRIKKSRFKRIGIFNETKENYFSCSA